MQEYGDINTEEASLRPFIDRATEGTDVEEAVQCIYCCKLYSAPVQVTLHSAEWVVVEKFWRKYGTGSGFIGVCDDCQENEDFFYGFECSCQELSSQGFQCLNPFFEIHSDQLCHMCQLPCHLFCSLVSHVVSESDFTLLGEGVQLTCMKCAFHSQDSSDSSLFGKKDWDLLQPGKFSPLIFEFPFPVRLDDVKGVLASSFANIDDPYCSKIKNLFDSGLAKFAGLEIPLGDEVLTSGWCPEGIRSVPIIIPFPLISRKAGDIGDEEKRMWLEKSILVSESLSFFNLGGKLRIADMEKMLQQKSPSLTMNCLDVVISFLNAATIDSDTTLVEKSLCKNKAITTFPLAFTRTLFECFHQMGRLGIVRFVQSIVHKNGASFFYAEQEAVVLLFPFQDLFSENIYMGIYYSNFSRPNEEESGPYLELASYGKQNGILQAERSYLFVLSEFFNILYTFHLKPGGLPVGELLHLAEWVIPQKRQSEAEIQLISCTEASDPVMEDSEQTNLVLMDIVSYYLQTAFEGPLKESPPKLESEIAVITNGFVSAIQKMIPLYLSQVFAADALLSSKVLNAVRTWEPIRNDEITGSRIAYTRIGIEIVRFVCQSGLLENMTMANFSMFLEHITSIKFIEKKGELMSASQLISYVVEMNKLQCQQCYHNQVAVYSENWEVIVPDVSCIDKWKELLSLDVEYFKSYARTVWQFAGNPIEVGGTTYSDLFHFFETFDGGKYKKLAEDLDNNVGGIASSLSYYHLDTVTTLVSMLFHHMHLDDVAVLSTTTSQVKAMEEQIKLGLSTPVTVPDHFKRLICICQEADRNHYVVLDIDIPSRQILYYDGLDHSIPQWEAFLSQRTSEKSPMLALSSDAIDWTELCQDLLVTLSYGRSTRSRSGVTVTLQVKEGLPRRLKEDTTSKTWLLLPAHIALENGLEQVCRQEDFYTCGAIAVTHVYKLMGGTFSDDCQKYRYAPNLMTLDWDTLVREWLRTCFRTELLHSHHKQFVLKPSVETTGSDTLQAMQAEQSDPPVATVDIPVTESKSLDHEMGAGDDKGDGTTESSIQPMEEEQELGAGDGIDDDATETVASNEENKNSDAAEANEPVVVETTATPLGQDEEVSDAGDPTAEVVDGSDHNEETGGGDIVSAPSGESDRQPKTPTPRTSRRFLAARATILNNTDPTTLELTDLKSSLRVTNTPGSRNHSWEVNDGLGLFDVTKDDVKKPVTIEGYPTWFQAVEIGEFFPYISRLKHTGGLEFQIYFRIAGLFEVSPLSKAVVEFLFCKEFIEQTKNGHEQWNHPIYTDYILDNTNDFERYMQNNETEFPDARLKIIKQVADELFYTGHKKVLTKVAHIIMHRRKYVREEIINTFEIMKRRGALQPDTTLRYILFPDPYWYGFIKEGKETKIRRLPRSWTRKNIPFYILQLCIADANNWKLFPLSVKDTPAMTDYYDEHAFDFESEDEDDEEPDRETYVTDRLLQISHILFYPHHEEAEEEMKHFFTLSESQYHPKVKGWYLGVTEGDPATYELLEYEWVLKNARKTFTDLLTRKQYQLKLLALPAGSSKDSKQEVRTPQMLRNNLRKKNFNRKQLKKKVEERIAEHDAAIEAYKMENPIMTDAQIDPSWPEVKYRQKKGEAYCMFYSMASALHWMGTELHFPDLVTVASNLYNYASRSVKNCITTEQRFYFMKKIIGGNVRTSDRISVEVTVPAMTSTTTIYGGGKETNDFDPTNRECSWYPTLAICESVDGSIEHAVTFVGKWIFDSNEEHALPITPEALNRCVPYGFKRVYEAFQIGEKFYKDNRTQIKNLLRKLQKKRKRSVSK